MNILDLITDVDENVLVEEGDGIYREELDPLRTGRAWPKSWRVGNLQQALNSVQAGQTVHIKAGTYSMNATFRNCTVYSNSNAGFYVRQP